MTHNQITMNNVTKIYCGTYGKYAAGSIEGAWMDLSDYSDARELMDAMAKLHQDEEDPEFMIQDKEGVLYDLIEESMSFDDWCAVYDTMQDIENSYLEPEVILAYVECIGTGWEHNTVELAEDAYMGKYDSDEDFAMSMAEETGAIQENLSWPHNCIDWEWAARELMYDYWEESGHYFINH